MNKQQLEILENEVNAELASSATSTAEPITDGVVDFESYLASTPKILWILKEPYDEIVDANPSGGGFSITRDALAIGKFGNKPPFAPMAYVAYAVFNNFRKWADILDVTDDPEVKAAIKRIAYINVNKVPALSTSGGTDLASLFRRNRRLLLKQINGMQPDVIIGGSTLYLFFEDFGLKREEFTDNGSVGFCRKEGRLYIEAHHPSQRNTVKRDVYVDDIVSVIKTHSPVQPLLQS